MRHPFRTAGAALLATALGTGCDDPTLLRPAPEQDRALILFTALDADSATQALFVEATDVAGRFDGFVRAEIFDEAGNLVAAELQERVPEIDEPGESLADLLLPCADRYGLLGTANPATCFRFGFRPEHGAGYRVRVTAEGRNPAQAATRVPGDFEILDVSVGGAPPGTEGLEVRWTPGEGAHGYFVALRSDTFVCYNIHGCLNGWFAATQATELRAVVPKEKLSEGSGPWHLDVYAVDRGLYEYLTTGSGGEFFAVPPVQNVEGGYGVVGAWLRRSKRLSP